MLLDPENTLFVRGAPPVLLLTEAPFHDALPTPAGTVPVCEGWTIVPRLTLCVVDGPGDHGVLVPALAAPLAGTGTMTDWCEDTTQAAGAIVLSLPHLPDTLDWPTLLASPATRGGFMPALT